MNTPSHFLMTVVAGKFSRERPPRFALAMGSVAPDVALYFLSFGGIYYYTQVLGWDASRTFKHLFDTMFYQDPGWIISHNLLHAPILVGLLGGLAGLGARLQIPAMRWFCWFFAACFLHSVVDVLTHHDDGPLLFFPFHWGYRFASPVSYWDPEHFGREFMVFEGVLDLMLIGMIIRWRNVWRDPGQQDIPA